MQIKNATRRNHVVNSCSLLGPPKPPPSDGAHKGSWHGLNLAAKPKASIAGRPLCDVTGRLWDLCAYIHTMCIATNHPLLAKREVSNTQRRATLYSGAALSLWLDETRVHSKGSYLTPGTEEPRHSQSVEMVAPCWALRGMTMAHRASSSAPAKSVGVLA